uniref:Uncharacterized protein n=1 Tax=Chromera velia CCMP2878 TaxID=1169474 RepID=A0A0G4I3D5_9ALVE|eukprot:Cvel_10642.t1-p1 / transcript=Cvel_10642.t1 / gene=Cvel_10642 / organism=Chromera_velia_CCMP2878 / gene_product=hypothetical protein / transcript_product=hypothetical protein / location=Cvel_scaffold646:50481-51305(+) / protein_length=275 / sequence_SO=supercontig / SO=protein_coding / is_pseudo=false
MQPRRSKRVKAAAEEKEDREEGQQSDGQPPLRKQLKKPVLKSDAEPCTWIEGKEAFIETFRANAEANGCRVEVLDRFDGEDLPAELRGLVWKIALVRGSGSDREEVDHLSVWFAGLHDTIDRTHLCNHSTMKIVVWYLKLTDHAGWERVRSQFFSRKHVLLVADNDKCKDDSRWFFLGEGETRGASSAMERGEWDAYMQAAGGRLFSFLSNQDSAPGPEGEAPKRPAHYDVSLSLLFAKLLKADLQALAEHSRHGVLGCTVNRFKCSLCNPQGTV